MWRVRPRSEELYEAKKPSRVNGKNGDSVDGDSDRHVYLSYDRSGDGDAGDKSSLYSDLEGSPDMLLPLKAA
jgi:hypothetical protein